MISNIYKVETGEKVIVIGLTHEEINGLVEDDSLLRITPAEGQERAEGQPDVIIYSAKDEEALTGEMITMFGTPGDDVPKKTGGNGQ